MATDSWTQQGCNIHLQCYTGYLAMGNTIQSMTIRAGTLRKYLDKTAKYIQSQRQTVLPNPGDRPPLDPRQDYRVSYTGKLHMAEGISTILKEIDRWSKITKKGSPLAVSMLTDMVSTTAMLPSYHQLSALTDWCLVGIYLGFRLSEYLQLQGVSKITRIAINDRDLLPKAFILEDVTCYAAGGRKLTHAQALANEKSRRSG